MDVGLNKSDIIDGRFTIELKSRAERGISNIEFKYPILKKQK